MEAERERGRRGPSSRQVADIFRGVAELAMSFKLSPEAAGEVFSTLDEVTASGTAYLTSGYSDWRVVRQAGKTLIDMTG